MQIPEASKTMKELECLVADEKMDIIGIEETWKNEDDQWDMIVLQYIPQRNGVVLYVKSGYRIQLENVRKPSSITIGVWGLWAAPDFTLRRPKSPIPTLPPQPLFDNLWCAQVPATLCFHI